MTVRELITQLQALPNQDERVATSSRDGINLCDAVEREEFCTVGNSKYCSVSVEYYPEFNDPEEDGPLESIVVIR